MWQCLIELNNIHSVAWRVLPFLGWYVPQRNSHGHSLQRYTWGCSGLPQWLRGKESTCNSGHTGFSLWVWKIPLEEGMATPSSILARKIPRTEEPSRLWSMGSQRVRHDKHTHFEVSSVQFSCSVVSDPLWPHELQHTRSPCPSPIPRVYSNSCPLSWWCHSTISSSVVSFSSSLLYSQNQGLFKWVSSSHQVAKYWEFQLQHQSLQWIFRSDFLYDGLVWISLQSKELSRVFFNTTVQKHQFFGT